MRLVNLARRPFENLRPVRRLTALLWVLGVGFLLINLWLFWGHLTGFSATRGQLADVRTSLRAETEHLDRVEADVAALALEAQNETVSNLNQLIEKRIFPWSLLFDRLEGVLPHDVRLQGVRPQGQEIKIEKKRSERTSSSRRRGRTRSRAKREEPTGVVAIGLNGVSRSEEALLDFVDSLWRDPTFDGPTLKGERRNATNEIEFTLDVRFLTQVAASLADQDDSPPGNTEGAIAANDPDSGSVGAAGIPIVEAPAASALAAGADATATRAPTVEPAAEPTRAATLPTASSNASASAGEERPATRARSTGRSPGLVPRSRLSSGRNNGRGTGEPATAPTPITGTPRERRPRTTTPQATPQIPGVVVLPGARPAPQAPITAPPAAPGPGGTRPADPAAPQPGTTRPRPITSPTPDPDTPAPPSPNASAGASLGGGAP